VTPTRGWIVDIDVWRAVFGWIFTAGEPAGGGDGRPPISAALEARAPSRRDVHISFKRRRDAADTPMTVGLSRFRRSAMIFAAGTMTQVRSFVIVAGSTTPTMVLDDGRGTFDP